LWLWTLMVLCDAVTVCVRECRKLELGGSQLAGTIPESLGSLTSLK
jgi:hypothetical protein